MVDRFAADIVGETRTALDDLASNFVSSDAQGPQAYAETMLGLHPEHDWDLLTNDAVAAVNMFMIGLEEGGNPSSDHG